MILDCFIIFVLECPVLWYSCFSFFPCLVVLTHPVLWSSLQGETVHLQESLGSWSFQRLQLIDLRLLLDSPHVFLVLLNLDSLAGFASWRSFSPGLLHVLVLESPVLWCSYCSRFLNCPVVLTRLVLWCSLQEPQPSLGELGLLIYIFLKCSLILHVFLVLPNVDSLAGFV